MPEGVFNQFHSAHYSSKRKEKTLFMLTVSNKFGINTKLKN